MKRAHKNVRSSICQFLILLLALGTVFVSTGCMSLKQLFDLKGIIVSKDDQVFQGETATVTIDMSDADKSYSFNATSDPVENGYPIRFEASNTSTVTVTRSASDSSNYTIKAVNSGWCDVTVECSVAYKFTFVVYVTDKAKGITVASLTRQRTEYYAALAEQEAAAAQEETRSTTTAAKKLLTSSSVVKIQSDLTTAELYYPIGFTSTIDEVDEPLQYQWYSNGKALGVKGSKDGRMANLEHYAPIEAGEYSVYLEVTGSESGVKVKSAPITVTYILVDHRPEYAGTWVLSKAKSELAPPGKYMTLDGKIYDMFKDEKTGDWIFSPEPVASLASTGYVITDNVSTNKTYIDSETKRLRVFINNVENSYIKSAVTTRSMQFVDSSTTLRISAKDTNLEVGKTAKIISKHSELDEDLTYQWYVNGKAIAKETNSSLEVSLSEAKSFEYYVVATGVTSKKSVTSNKLTVSFYVADHRSEFAGAWLRSGSSPTAGKYITADGKIRDMYKEAKSGEWIYKPEVVATIAADGNTITDLVSTNSSKIENGKLVVIESKVAYTYAKSTVSARPAIYVDSSTTLTLSAKYKSVEVGSSSKIIAKHSELDEDLTYQWYAAGKPVSGTESSYSATSAEAKTIEYYVVATGVTSKKTVTSNKISITYSLVDHRAEFAGAWVNDKSANTGVYMSIDGKMYDMYKDSASGEWLYKPGVMVVMASSGYDFTSRAGSSVSAKVVDGKIVVTNKGVDSTYSKSTVSPRAAKFVDSTTSLIITAAGNAPLNSTVKFSVKATTLDEKLTYQWYVNGVAVNSAKGTSASFEDTSAEAKTNEYYLVAKGATSGVSVTSNKVSVTFYSVDHRKEFAGAWVKDKTANGGKWITADGKIYDMYQDMAGDVFIDQWVYRPEVVATMASEGYGITDHVATNKSKIVNGKLVVTANGVESTYSKANIVPRLAKYIDSTTKLTITASATSAEVLYGSVNIDSKISDVDEGVTYQWYMNGTAVNNAKGTKSSYETDECPDPRTVEYYLVAKGSRSGKTVTSNKVKVTFNYVDHRPEFVGAWVAEKNNDGSGRYIAADGKIYYMYADEDANAWLYEPDVIATMASKGYEITDNVSANKTKIVNGKLVVKANGVEKTYVKSKVVPRAVKYIDSTTKLTITASQTTVKVDTNVTLKASITSCDEVVDYQWFFDDGKNDGSDKGPTHVTQFSEPMTHSLYAVATGRTSKKTVKSNTVTIKFVMDSIRPEMAGAWVNKSDSKDAVYFKENGQLYVMNQKSASDWYLSPKPIAQLADDSAIINEVDPETYKIWVNRTEKTLYIEKNGKRAEYKQNKSLKARDGKYISSITEKVLIGKSKETISATDTAGTITLSVRSAMLSNLDEEVAYQWINAETDKLIKNKNESVYVYTRSDDLTETTTVSRALRITGKTSGANITSETATFTVEPKNVLGLLKGYWASSGDTSTGYAILEDGSVYKAFEKTTTVGKTTQKKNLYYGSAVATADRLGKFAKKGNLVFTFNEEDKTLSVAEDASSSAKGKTLVLSRVSTRIIDKATLLTARSTITLAANVKTTARVGDTVKFTVTLPAVDEDAEITWFLNGVKTGRTGNEFEVPVPTAMGGTTFKVQAFANGALSGVQIASAEMSIAVDAVSPADALRNNLQKTDTKTNGADLKTGTETTKTTTKK